MRTKAVTVDQIAPFHKGPGIRWIEIHRPREFSAVLARLEEDGVCNRVHRLKPSLLKLSTVGRSHGDIAIMHKICRWTETSRRVASVSDELVACNRMLAGRLADRAKAGRNYRSIRAHLLPVFWTMLPDGLVPNVQCEMRPPSGPDAWLSRDRNHAVV